VILAFYPADWSPVCGDQMALYNEILPEFRTEDRTSPLQTLLTGDLVVRFDVSHLGSAKWRHRRPQKRKPEGVCANRSSELANRLGDNLAQNSLVFQTHLRAEIQVKAKTSHFRPLAGLA
jgi:hypothetical protein